MTETEYRNNIQIELAKLGIKVWRHTVSLLYAADGTPVKVGTPGQADLWGFVPHNGRAIFLSIETKSHNGRIKPNQTAWANMVRSAGGVAIICRPGDDIISQIRSQLK